MALDDIKLLEFVDKNQWYKSNYNLPFAPSCDFRARIMISEDLTVISNVFMKLSLEKYIVEEIELIMGTCAECSSPSNDYIPQKSLIIACDFWNTN